MEDIYASAGRGVIPDIEYDFTQEYLSRLKGADFIPVRSSKKYLSRNNGGSHRNYISPLMRTINNSRFHFQDKKA